MANGQYMLGRNFKLQKVGDLDWIQDNYEVDSILHSIDELVVLNVDRDGKNIDTFITHLTVLCKQCFMPVSAGGGVVSISNARKILKAGADKIIVNSILATDKALVKELVKVFGSQCIVASIDYKKEEGLLKTYIKDGSVSSDMTLDEAVENALKLGVGELYLNSIDREGTGQGLDINVLQSISKKSKVPVIAAGGVERTDQFQEGIKDADVQAVAASDLLYFMGDSLIEARESMTESGCNMAKWASLSEFEALHKNIATKENT